MIPVEKLSRTDISRFRFENIGPYRIEVEVNEKCMNADKATRNERTRATLEYFNIVHSKTICVGAEIRKRAPIIIT